MKNLGKKLMHSAYGLGGAIVIVGALFKLTHIEVGPLNGSIMLGAGLITEALIFVISAFDYSGIGADAPAAGGGMPNIDGKGVEDSLDNLKKNAADLSDKLNNVSKSIK